MPYVSDAQRRKFHAMERRGQIETSTVNEFDKESKWIKLPERVTKRNNAIERRVKNAV